MNSESESDWDSMSEAPPLPSSHKNGALQSQQNGALQPQRNGALQANSVLQRQDNLVSSTANGQRSKGKNHLNILIQRP